MPASPAVPRPSRRYVEKDLGEEYLFYDRDGDQVHVLNGSAREIYLACDGSRSVEGITVLLRERFAVDEGTARRDVEETLAKLSEAGLLTLG
jgi:hypothetical protein